MDPVLLGGLAAATVVYGVATAALVLLFGSGYTAGWSARALPDRRLLENVRRGLDTQPFLDALFHAPDRQLVVSQTGGVLHSDRSRHRSLVDRAPLRAERPRATRRPPARIGD